MIDNEIGSSLGPYELVSPLGAGGMGEVFRARDSRLHREVALKVLPGEVASDTGRMRRFLQEARAASALNHPNILSIYDVGSENGTQFIVSEIVEGESLRSLLNKGPLSLKKFLEIAIQIAAGLTAAHEAGIVHRDLKPENIMVGRDQHVKILDFGLAKPLFESGSSEEQTRSILTMPGVILGTASYMSPEQARGEATDFRSDHFSFGLILYEMATGKKAFQRDTPIQILSAIITEEPSTISSLNVKFPAPLRWLIERCLAKDPRERYGATIDLYHELRAFRDHLSETSYSGETAIPGALPKKPRRWIAPATIAFCTLVIGFLTALVLAPHRGPDVASYQFAPFAMNDGVEDAPAWSPDGKSVAYNAEVNGTMQIFTRSTTATVPIQVTHTETDSYGPIWSPDGSRIYYSSKRKDESIADIWSIGAVGGDPQRVMEDGYSPAISPDGKTLLFLRDAKKSPTISEVMISSPIGSAPKAYNRAPFTGRSYEKSGLLFSPDGKKILFTSVPWESKSSEFWVVPFPDGQPRKLPGFENQFCYGFSWMPDSRHVILSLKLSESQSAHLWLADSEKLSLQPLTTGILNEMAPAVSPDGKQILFASGNGQYDLVEVPLDGSPVHDLTSTPLNEKAPAWSPQGNQFAYVANKNGTDSIWIKSIPEGFERPLVTDKDFSDGETTYFSRPSFSPDGQRIAYHRGTKTHEGEIWISNVAGGAPARLYADQQYQYTPSWSPDGVSIAYLTGKQGVISLAVIRVGGTQAPQIYATDILYFQPKWSPDGKWILYQSKDGMELVSADGKTFRKWTTDHWLTGGWSKDGKTLYYIRQNENRRLVVESMNVQTGDRKLISDAGVPPVLNSEVPFAGFSMSPDGKSFVTSILREKADLWSLDGVTPESDYSRFLFWK